MRIRFLIVLAFTLASGCVYRMNIQQGNLLDEPAVAQLKQGMTRSQVRYILGTPMIPNAFDAQRWDYLYYLKIGRLGRAKQHRLTVFFANDRVERTETDGAPMTASDYGGVNVKPKRGLWARLFHRSKAAPAPAQKSAAPPESAAAQKSAAPPESAAAQKAAAPPNPAPAPVPSGAAPAAGTPEPAGSP
ncbi:MAG TPA: outer membrane protein assembly factor BamE [Steroidobacteraceae bacterium]